VSDELFAQLGQKIYSEWMCARLSPREEYAQLAGLLTISKAKDAPA